MRLVVAALLALLSSTASAENYQIAPVTLPDGKSTMAVLETATGRVWLLTCSSECVASAPVGQEARRRMVLGVDSPFLEPLRYRLSDGTQAVRPAE